MVAPRSRSAPIFRTCGKPCPKNKLSPNTSATRFRPMKSAPIKSLGSRLLGIKHVDCRRHEPHLACAQRAASLLKNYGHGRCKARRSGAQVPPRMHGASFEHPYTLGGFAESLRYIGKAFGRRTRNRWKYG